jgi:hypothetical protein
MRTHFFWNMTPRHWVVGGALFFSSEFKTLNITTLYSFEISGAGYLVTRRRVSEERSLKLTAVKTRKLAFLTFVV